jgi:integrase
MARKSKNQTEQPRSVIFSDYDKWVVPKGKKLPEMKETKIRTVDDPDCLTRVLPGVGVMIEESDTGSNNIIFDRHKCLSMEMQICVDSIYVRALESRKKVSTVTKWRNSFNHFMKEISPNCDKELCRITLSMLTYYNEGKSANMQKNIRAVLVFWIKETKFPGIAEDLEHYLSYSKSPKAMSTPVIQATKPMERPFSKGQINNIKNTVEDLYINGVFNPQDYCLWKMAIGEALRPSQLRLLMVSDFQVRGSVVYGKVPIIKQPGMRGRDYLFDVKYSTSVSGAIINQLEYIKKLSGSDDINDYPFFCITYSNKLKKRVSINKRINVLNQMIRSRKQIVKSEVNSEIESELDLFLRRFKHTKLTDLALRGASVEMLARAGFQTSTVSLKHYINENPDMFSEYQKQMLDVHEMINSAFRGSIVDKDACKNMDNDHYILNNDASANLGSCSADICGVLSPEGCYLCPSFQAFKEADHQKLYDRIESRKIQYINNNANQSVVLRDENILLAVAKVINEIKKINGDSV